MPYRFTTITGVLLVLATQVAGAESPLPDPIAPAVIGRPLDQITRSHSHRAKARAERPAQDRHAAARPGRDATRPAAATTHAPAVATTPAPAFASTPAPAVAAPAAPAVAAAPAIVVPPPTATLGAAPPAPGAVPPAQHAAKQALDDRYDPRATIADDVGKGSHLGRKPLGPGAYFSSRAQALVRNYYASHPGTGKASQWKIGEPVPPKTTMTGVPDDVRAGLPRVPPGLQYVQVDGEVVLVAMQSKMVVDGVTRATR